MKLEVISCPTSLIYLGGNKNLKTSIQFRERIRDVKLTRSPLYLVIHKSSYEEYSSHQLDDERSQWCIHQRHREHHVIDLRRILRQMHPLLHLSYSQSFQINALPDMDFRIILICRYKNHGRLSQFQNPPVWVQEVRQIYQMNMDT